MFEAIKILLRKRLKPKSNGKEILIQNHDVQLQFFRCQIEILSALQGAVHNHDSRHKIASSIEAMDAVTRLTLIDFLFTEVGDWKTERKETEFADKKGERESFLEWTHRIHP